MPSAPSPTTKATLDGRRRCSAWSRPSLAVDDRLNVADCLEGLASAATRQGTGIEQRASSEPPTRCAMTSDPVAAHLRAPHDKAVADTKAAIGEEQFTAAWEAGRTTPIDQGVAVALDLAAHLAHRPTTQQPSQPPPHPMT